MLDSQGELIALTTEIKIGVTPTVEFAGTAQGLAWTESGELWAALQKESDYQGIQLQPTGHRRVDPGGENSRTNADGFGTRVAVQTAGPNLHA